MGPHSTKNRLIKYLSMKQYFSLSCFFIFLFISCVKQKPDSSFIFQSTDQGVRLFENGQPIFFYQEKPKSQDGKYICNNYLHPLYSLKGDTLTEEFPADHPYHRGIFWAWHQIYVNGKSVGDSWTMKNIKQDIVNMTTITENNTAQLKLLVLWKYLLFENYTPIVSEETTITVHGVENNIRKIDFRISLNALVAGVEIGGADNEKGYGGFCARLKLPDNLIFTSLNDKVIPTTEQIITGPWMDFSASFGSNSEVSGITIICHPKTPNYPAPWILRQKESMQNIVFPGRIRIEIPMIEPVVLYYRLIIHDGKSERVNIRKLQNEYSKFDVSK